MIKPGGSYPNKIKQAVIEAYKNNVPYAQITRKYGVSHQTISNWVKNNNMTQKRKSADWKYIHNEVLGI